MLAEPERTSFDLAFDLFGIPVRVNPWFWGIAALLGFQLKEPALIALWVACMFVAILVHELGHALTAIAFGARDQRIVLYGFGGLTIGPSGGLKRWQRILELLAGPGAGFLLFGALYGLDFALGHPTERSYFVANAFRFIALICVVWGVMNLLPVYPLDGGQVVSELLQKLRPHDGFGWALKISMVVAGGVAVLLLTQRYFFAALLFGSLAFSSYQTLQARGAGGGPQGPAREPWERDPDWWK